MGIVAHCTKAGERRFRLRWQAPEGLETAPVQRYVVAAADPTSTVAATRAPIRLSTLEPDYSQELGRYVTLDELATYELAEEEVSERVPDLFQQSSFTLMVAAANKVGQSPWASVIVDISGSTEPLSRTSTPATCSTRTSGTSVTCTSYSV